ncbi:RidA family protein, partial [Paraburkholderia sp. SIMBA_050]
GDKAGHARSAFSQRQLPADAAVILVVIAEIRPA